MSIATTLVTMAIVLIWFGVAEPMLMRMHLSRRAALTLMGLLLIGSLVPPIYFGVLRLHVGALVAAGLVCTYLLLGEDSRRAVIWVLLTSAALAGVIFVLTWVTPGLIEQMSAGREVLVGVFAGLMAGLLLRRPRSSAACAVIAVVAADLVVGAADWVLGQEIGLLLGHTGVADAFVTAGLSASLIAALLAAALERVPLWRPRHGQ